MSFTFKSLLHYEFISVYDMRQKPNLIILHVDAQLFQNNLMKRLFAPLYCLCFFIKNHLTVFMWVYFGLSVVLQIDLFVYSFANTTPS